jgi:hypothetical protein
MDFKLRMRLHLKGYEMWYAMTFDKIPQILCKKGSTKRKEGCLSKPHQVQTQGRPAVPPLASVVLERFGGPRMISSGHASIDLDHLECSRTIAGLARPRYSLILLCTQFSSDELSPCIPRVRPSADGHMVSSQPQFQVAT